MNKIIIKNENFKNENFKNENFKIKCENLFSYNKECTIAEIDCNKKSQLNNLYKQIINSNFLETITKTLLSKSNNDKSNNDKSNNDKSNLDNKSELNEKFFIHSQYYIFYEIKMNFNLIERRDKSNITSITTLVYKSGIHVHIRQIQSFFILFIDDSILFFNDKLIKYNDMIKILSNFNYLCNDLLNIIIEYLPEWMNI